MSIEHIPHIPERQTKPAVALVSMSRSGLLEVSGQLARDGVGVSHAIIAGDSNLSLEGGGIGTLTALSVLQADPGTEIIVLIGAAAPPKATRVVLDQVRDSDKPTVVCLLGMEPRLVWRAGAIPASRLDEAAMRAAAWVLGQDQALVSTRLEELDDELKAQALELRPLIGRGRRKVLGLLSSRVFGLEAQLMLGDVAGSEAESGFQNLSRLGSRKRPKPGATAADQRAALHRALRRPDAAIVLADVGFDGLSGSSLEAALPLGRPAGSILIAHASAEIALPHGKEIARGTRAPDLALVSSNAAAARLAAFCMKG